MIKYLVGAAAVALGLGAAACGSTSLSASESNKFVEAQLATVLPSQANVKSDCPDTDEAKKGGTFTCDITTSGGKGTVTVHITDVDGEKVRLSFTATDIKVS